MAPPSKSTTASLVEEKIRPYFDNLTLQITSVKEDLSELKDSHASVERTLRGTNGEIGLITEFTKLQQAFKIHSDSEASCPIHSVTQLLYGDPKVADSTPGLVSQVADLQKWKRGLNKIYWVLVSAIVVGVINILFNALPRVIEVIYQIPTPK